VSCGVVSDVCFQSITVSITVFFHRHTVITSHAYGAHILCGKFQSTAVTQVQGRIHHSDSKTEVCSKNIATKFPQDGTECAIEHVEGSGKVGIIQ
jgi:hypothetical protein